MTKIQKHTLLLAICIATMLTGLLMYYLNLKSMNVAPLVKVIISRANIPANSVITEKEIEETSIPSKFVLSNALGDKRQVIGKIAKVDISVGEQILSNKIQLEKKLEKIADDLPQGYRAITIKVDQVGSVNHQIKTGDYVDILLYYKTRQDQTSPQPLQSEIVKTLFQQVQVINSSGATGSGDCFVTLCLKPEAVEKLFMADAVGKIRFTLRPHDDKQALALPGTGYNSLN